MTQAAEVPHVPSAQEIQDKEIQLVLRQLRDIELVLRSIRERLGKLL